MAPSADLQRLEGRQVHKCVAGYAGDGIAVQVPADKSLLAVSEEICTAAIPRDSCGGGKPVDGWCINNKK